MLVNFLHLAVKGRVSSEGNKDQNSLTLLSFLCGAPDRPHAVPLIFNSLADHVFGPNLLCDAAPTSPQRDCKLPTHAQAHLIVFRTALVSFPSLQLSHSFSFSQFVTPSCANHSTTRLFGTHQTNSRPTAMKK